MKKSVAIILAVILLMNCFTILVSAQSIDLAQTGGYIVEVTSYEQLKEEVYNSPNGSIYVLKNDIIVEDNDNDNEIVVGILSSCTLDLNGYTLSRSTRGIDNCLINVINGAQFTVIDSSYDKSGKMAFISGNYAGTSSVVIANGDVNILAGNFEIQTPYQVGGGTVFLVETGYLNIYDGVFDSHTAFGGDTIELRHNAYLYDVPHCNVFGGTFYGKISNFEVSSYNNFSSYGCFYPSVYVFDGEFYIANPDDEYAGFAYCNNGWGQVIVAGGTVYYKCLNNSDQRFLDGVNKNSASVEFAGKTGQYYEITPPTMIGCEDLGISARLGSMFMKKEVSYYNEKGAVYQQNQEYIEDILNHIDSINVSSTTEESPLLWIENTDNVKTVLWYMSDQENYSGENTPWSELADYRGNVQPFRFDFRPENNTNLYVRALITTDNGEEIEDVIVIYYQELKPNPPVISVKITGIDEPVVGAHPDFTCDNTSMYYIDGVYWTDVTTSSHKWLKETDVFETGHTYELEVWLRTTDGYKFKTDSYGYTDITATIGDKDAEVIPGSEVAVIINVTYTLENSQEFTLGDVDGNGEVNILDATLIQLYIASLEELSDAQLKAADTDKSKDVTIMDATAIQLFIAKIITEF